MRYVVTGTVRKVGSQLRVTADLVDAIGGNTIWAEHYDGDLADVFDFQDRITARIVGTLESTLRVTEAQRALHKHPESLDAYDCVLRAFALLYRLFHKDFLQAGELLDESDLPRSGLCRGVRLASLVVPVEVWARLDNRPGIGKA